MEPFADHLPTVRGALCLNTRHRGANCTRCADTCPVDALPLVQGLPHLVDEACVACGACLAACPTDAITQTRPPEPTLLQTLDNLPPVPLLLACPLAPAEDGVTAPVAAVVRHARCLAGLDVGHLLAATGGGQRTIWLDDRPCATCPIGRLHQTIHATAQAADTLLQGFGHPPRIFLYSAHPEAHLPAPHPRPVLDGMQPRLSRRDLFRSLGRMARDRVSQALDEAPPMVLPGAPVEMRLPKRLPESRRRLLQELARAAQAHPPEMWTDWLPAHAIPFADIQVDPALCSGCGLCARFCPTEALVFLSDSPLALNRNDPPQPFQLAFRAGLCLDCNICQAACPEDAVAKGDWLAPGDLLDEEWSLLVEGSLVACEVCGAATAPRPGDPGPRCYACRGGAGVVRPLHDGAGLLDDLRRRLGLDNEPD